MGYRVNDPAPGHPEAWVDRARCGTASRVTVSDDDVTCETGNDGDADADGPLCTTEGLAAIMAGQPRQSPPRGDNTDPIGASVVMRDLFADHQNRSGDNHQCFSA